MNSVRDTADTMMGALERELELPSAAHRVTSYYSEAGGTFTGRRFDDLGGRGDSPDDRNVVTPADLLALSTLSVPVPGTAAIELIEGPASETVAELLSAIPSGLTLADPGREVDEILDGVGVGLYRQVQAVKGMGWVRTHKLLARKRPRLFPVYDTVVWEALDRPSQFWAPLRACFTELGLASLVEKVRARADVPAGISDLRVLDVAIWMNHARSQS